jgi:hypothetical protein
MVRRQAPTRARAEPGLALHAAAARAEALLKERDRLLRDVGKKKQQLERARVTVEQDEQATRTRIAPLLERREALVRELAALFEELVRDARLSKRALQQVKKQRALLELQGVLPPLEPAGNRQETGQAGGRRQPRARQRPDPTVRDVASARQPDPERRTLRDIFRGLARAVHPDRALHEPERLRRTEAMKEVTRAYEAGDLARLLELESTWQNERVLAGEGDAEARCRELERINRELLKQVRHLTRELRDVKRDARSPGPLPRVVERATRELAELTSIRDFVSSLRR